MKHNQKQIFLISVSNHILENCLKSYKVLFNLQIVDFLFKLRELYDEDVLVNFVIQKSRFDVHLFDFQSLIAIMTYIVL